MSISDISSSYEEIIKQIDVAAIGLTAKIKEVKDRGENYTADYETRVLISQISVLMKKAMQN